MRCITAVLVQSRTRTVFPTCAILTRETHPSALAGAAGSSRMRANQRDNRTSGYLTPGGQIPCIGRRQPHDFAAAEPRTAGPSGACWTGFATQAPRGSGKTDARHFRPASFFEGQVLTRSALPQPEINGPRLDRCWSVGLVAFGVPSNCCHGQSARKTTPRFTNR